MINTISLFSAAVLLSSSLSSAHAGSAWKYKPGDSGKCYYSDLSPGLEQAATGGREAGPMRTMAGPETLQVVSLATLRGSGTSSHSSASPNSIDNKIQGARQQKSEIKATGRAIDEAKLKTMLILLGMLDK